MKKIKLNWDSTTDKGKLIPIHLHFSSLIIYSTLLFCPGSESIALFYPTVDISRHCSKAQSSGVNNPVVPKILTFHDTLKSEYLSSINRLKIAFTEGKFLLTFIIRNASLKLFGQKLISHSKKLPESLIATLLILSVNDQNGTNYFSNLFVDQQDAFPMKQTGSLLACDHNVFLTHPGLNS